MEVKGVMGLLKKSYEISVWDDVYDLNTGKFHEEKAAIIGSNFMTS
jgi:hypothetical protein